MKILIAGGSGFIGSHLTKHYLKNGHNVVIIDNFLTGKISNLKNETENKLLQLIKADIVDYDFSRFSSFDIIYDLASPASPAVFDKLSFEILKTNSIGLMNLLDFFVRSKSRTFVFASTSEVYGDPKVSPQPENYFGNVHTTGPRSAYDEGKRFAEAIVFAYLRKYKIDVRIARIFNTYGPFMDKNDGRFISNFINQALKNSPITVYGDGSQTRSACFIDDMIKGLISLGETKDLNGQIINIGNPDERKIIDVARLIKKLIGSKSKIEFLPIGEDDPKKRCPNIDKAKKMLKWKPNIELEKGLKLTINYFKNL